MGTLHSQLRIAIVIYGQHCFDFQINILIILSTTLKLSLSLGANSWWPLKGCNSNYTNLFVKLGIICKAEWGASDA